MNILVSGININYKIEGSGRDILLLHGWGANLKTVDPIFNLLKSKFRVCSLDLPGFGDSGLPPTDWNVYSFADFVVEFIAKVGIKNPILIGHSFGGRLSIILAGKKMIAINKIILVDSAGIKPKRGIDYYFKVYSYKTAKNAAKLLGKFSEGGAEKLKSKFGSADYKNADPTMRTIMVRVVNEDLTYLMRDVSPSTLLIWGELDEATPLGDAKLMESIMPDAGLVVLKGAGHYSYLDCHDIFNAVVNKFLENDVIRKGE